MQKHAHTILVGKTFESQRVGGQDLNTKVTQQNVITWGVGRPPPC